MKPLVVLTVLFVLSIGQVQRLSSSYKNDVKWKFGTNIFHGDILARNVDQAPAISSVYKNKSIMPIIREEPVVTTVYKKMPVVSDIFQKKSFQLSRTNKNPLVQNISKQQSAVFKAHSVASHIYKSVYKQQATVPIVRKQQSIVSNIYRSQPIRPVVHHQQQSLQRFSRFTGRFREEAGASRMELSVQSSSLDCS